MNHLRIAFIEPHLRLYGGIRRIIELSNRLGDRGHDVTIYHSDGSPCDWMECRARILPKSHVLRQSHDALLFNDPALSDIIYSCLTQARAKFYYVLELYNKDSLVGFKPELLKIWRGWTRRMIWLRLCLRTPYIKLANSTWEAEWLRHHMAIESEVVIGGINPAMFHPVSVERTADPIIVLCSGDPRARKGSDVIKRALDLARQQGVNLNLETYYGKGYRQDEMAYVYSSAHIFADAQWSAGWNNPVAEAMACGTPVVCTGIGGVQDFARDEQTALVVPPGDAEAMGNAIIRLARGAELRERLAANALEFIQRFHWDNTTRRLEEVIAKHLAEGDHR